MIVDTARRVSLGDLRGGIRLETSSGSAEIATAAVAQPCAPFTRFATGRHQARAGELVEQRDRLRRGVRGFVMALDGLDNVDVHPGALVSIRSG